MEPWPEFPPTVESFPFTEQNWAQTPSAVQAYVSTLHDEMARLHNEIGQLHERVETLEARLQQNSTTSSKLPSSDSPDKKPRRRTGSTGSRKGGGKPGHPGHRQVLFAPTTVEELLPEWCACGSGDFDLIEPYSTHPEIERKWSGVIPTTPSSTTRRSTAPISS
jgi:hypothetical protein